MTFVGQPYHKNNSSKNNSIQFKSRFLSITKAGFFYYNQTFVYFNSSTRLLSVTTFFRYQKWFLFIMFITTFESYPKMFQKMLIIYLLKIHLTTTFLWILVSLCNLFELKLQFLLVLNAYFSKLYPKDTNFYV